MGLKSVGKNQRDVQHMPHIRSLAVPALLITVHVWHHTTKGQFSRHSDIKRCQDVSYRAPNLASMEQTETRMNLVKSAASYSVAVCSPNSELGMMGDKEQASSVDGSLHDRTQTLGRSVMDENLSPATSKALMGH